MIITQLSTSPGGSLAPLARQELTAPVGELPLRVFRRTLWLRIPTAGLAERLEMVSGAVLRATFGALEYDAATTPHAALRATVSSSSGGVLVTMDSPRQVVRVTLPANRGGGSRLEFYRMDGNTPADKPTVAVSREETMIITDTGSGIGANIRSARASTGGGPLVQHTGQGHFSNFSRFNVDFTDARFLLRLVNASGSPLALTPADILAISIRSYPRSPRIGIAVPPGAGIAPDTDAPIFVWRADGEIGHGTPFSAGVVDAGAALGGELGRMLDRLADAVSTAAPEGSAGVLPNAIDVALVIESDAPCLLSPPTSGAALRLELLRVRESFPDGSTKKVVRFDPTGAADGPIPIALPAGVDVRELELRLDLSLGGDRPTGAGASPSIAADGRTGVRCDASRRVAQRLRLDEAISSVAIALPLMPLAAGAEATLELRADVADTPTGAVLASGSVALGRPGRFTWSLLELPAPIVISTAPHWLVLTAPIASVVWLTAADGGWLRVLDASGTPLSTDRLDGIGALFDLRTRAGQAAANPPPLYLDFAGERVLLSTDGGGKPFADLAEAARTALSGAGGGGSLDLALTMSASDSGIVTAYPPRLVFT